MPLKQYAPHERSWDFVGLRESVPWPWMKQVASCRARRNYLLGHKATYYAVHWIEMKVYVLGIHHMNSGWWEQSRAEHWNGTTEQVAGRPAESGDIERKTKTLVCVW